MRYLSLNVMGSAFPHRNVAPLQSSAATSDSIWQQGPDTHREDFLPVLRATSELKIQNKINYPAPRSSRWGQEGWGSVLDGVRASSGISGFQQSFTFIFAAMALLLLSRKSLIPFSAATSSGLGAVPLV